VKVVYFEKLGRHRPGRMGRNELPMSEVANLGRHLAAMSSWNCSKIHEKKRDFDVGNGGGRFVDFLMELYSQTFCPCSFVLLGMRWSGRCVFGRYK
jgi:hypothetical protein